MKRRYDLRRSDNYPVVGKISYTCTGDGTFNVLLGFPVKSAMISWASVPVYEPVMSSSSESSSSSSSVDSSSSLSSSSSSSSEIHSSSSSSSSSVDSSSSSSSVSSYSSSSSSVDSNSTSSSSSVDSSSSSSSSSSLGSSSSSSSSSSVLNPWPGPFNLPRVYVLSYLENGFVVKYENIPEEIGYIEINYSAV